MNGLDLVVVAALAVGGVIGTRVGFLIRVLSWFGLGIGLLVRLRLMPRIAGSLAKSCAVCKSPSLSR